MFRHAAAIGKMVVYGLMVATMSIGFILGHDYVTQCNYFKAKDLMVLGNRRLNKSQVLRQAGIPPAVNILALNLKLARKRLLAHPLIANVSVTRELPATIVIHIEEHVAMAILDLGRKFVVNTKGEIFKELDGTDPKDLPLITGLKFSDITVGVLPRSAPFEAALTVLRMDRSSDKDLPHLKISRIDVDRELGLTLFGPNRIRSIKVGYSHYRRKFQNLENVLLYMETRKRFSNLDSIDLNNLNRIVVTPASNDLADGDHKEV